MGILGFQEGKLVEAESQLSAAAVLLPDNASIHYSLGVVMAAAGKYEEAIASYMRSIDIKADFSEAFNNLRISLAALGSHADAAHAYLKAIQYKPESLEPRYNLGVALFYEQGKGEEAVEAFVRVLERESCNDVERIFRETARRNCNQFLPFDVYRSLHLA